MLVNKLSANSEFCYKLSIELLGCVQPHLGEAQSCFLNGIKFLYISYPKIAEETSMVTGAEHSNGGRMEDEPNDLYQANANGMAFVKLVYVDVSLISFSVAAKIPQDSEVSSYCPV